MGYIKAFEKTINVSIDNILFIKTYDLMDFYYNLQEKKIEIYDEINALNQHRSVIITSLTKTGDIFSLTKSNIFWKHFIGTNLEKMSKLFNREIVEEILNNLEGNVDKIYKKCDFDLSKIIGYIYEIDLEKNITKKEFITFINLFSTTFLTNLILFNPPWLDEECIELLKERNIKTIIIFNEYSNIKKYVLEDLANVILVGKNTVSVYNEKELVNLSDDKEKIFDEKVFIKM
ncbi:MAG: hypothetical protein LBF02_01800 [Mycoplasmataceae bacterium]|nr:hypothetical protein [Mycoplasmataceae bacterium]